LAQADAGITNSILRAADFYICANDRQRDFWLGALAANGRVSPVGYAADPTMRGLIDVVPFGIPAERPQKARMVLKGVHQGIGESDRVLLWAGGLWDWFDPETLLRAVAALRVDHPDIKLYFMAKRHPDSDAVPEMPAAERAVALSHELGLLGSGVFFGDWIPYAERADYLLEADIGVSLHRDGIEARLAFRTRLLDYIWAGIPILASKGDHLGDLVEAENLGATVRPGDVSGLATAILSLLDERNARERRADDFQRIRQSLIWDKVLAPLERFVAEPRFAPDRDRTCTANYDPSAPGPDSLPHYQRTPVHRLPLRAVRLAREGGIAALAQEARRYVRWWLAYRH
jgi:glycosyltransferase involved in cell wall biosynthesis